MQYKSPLSADSLANLAERQVITVAQLNKRARQLLEGSFKTVWVEGEISNLSRPSSGHYYFTLKDSGAQVRCAMFKNRNQSLRFKLEAGMQVVARAKLSLYEARGDYQLIVENVTESGQGALQRAFEQLKTELAARGWFNSEHKQALPSSPMHIGIDTSANAAALHDILTVFKRRSPSTHITVFPCLMQGDTAPAQIVDAIECANHYASELNPPIEALIVGRGGGSIEDLWAFNDEQVADAIFNSELPIVSAVGHEIDFTISDFVADQRAPTPSAAAEMLNLDQTEQVNQLIKIRNRLNAAIAGQLVDHQKELTNVSKGLKHPGQKINEQSQTVDQLEIRLHKSILLKLANYKKQLANQQRAFNQAKPLRLVKNNFAKVDNLQHRLQLASKQNLHGKQHNLQTLAEKLHAVSPLATLARGYAIAKTADGKVITHAQQVAIDDKINITVANGVISAAVTGKQ